MATLYIWLCCVDFIMFDIAHPLDYPFRYFFFLKKRFLLELENTDQRAFSRKCHTQLAYKNQTVPSPRPPLRHPSGVASACWRLSGSGHKARTEKLCHGRASPRQSIVFPHECLHAPPVRQDTVPHPRNISSFADSQIPADPFGRRYSMPAPLINNPPQQTHARRAP